MKLRFVKFLTSRENEIEKKEEGGQRLKLQYLFSPGQAAALLPLLPPPSIISLSPTRPTSPHPLPPNLSAATGQKSNILQLSPPQLFRFSLSSS